MAHENILKMRKELVKFRYIEKRANFDKISNTRGFTAKNMFVVNVGLTWGF